MRVVIVGGVAGGMSAATRLRRLDGDAEIVVLERSGHVSFANCGLPYFVGGVIDDEASLTIVDPVQLAATYRLKIRVRTEVTAIDLVRRVLRLRTPEGTGELAYDKLVLSTGAAPVRPPIPGYERVRSLRTVEDAHALAEAVGTPPRSAVVVGGGFIGLEMVENLVRAGVPSVALVEAASHVLPPLDPEMAVLVADELVRHGVSLHLGAAVTEVRAHEVVLAGGATIPAALAVGAIGVRPDVGIARDAGLVIGAHGGLLVDEVGRTSDPDVYAVGDAVEKADAISGDASLVALANVANRQGRRVADHLAGLPSQGVPSLATAIVQVFGIAAATTGWSEERLRAAGRRFRAIHSHPYSHATYYPGATRLAAKLLFDPQDGAILGAQLVGANGVDKRIDVLATAMSGGLRAPALADLELAYAPPFSSAKDPVNLLGYMAENVLSGACDVVAPDDVAPLAAEGWTLLDVRSAAEHDRGAIPGSRNVPLDELWRRAHELGTGPVLVYCEVGQRGHTATAFLRERGIVARNLDGGYRTWTDARRAAALGAGDPAAGPVADSNDVAVERRRPPRITAAR